MGRPLSLDIASPVAPTPVAPQMPAAPPRPSFDLASLIGGAVGVGSLRSRWRNPRRGRSRTDRRVALNNRVAAPRALLAER